MAGNTSSTATKQITTSVVLELSVLFLLSGIKSIQKIQVKYYFGIRVDMKEES
jgi:hypothetical protein